jgi:hypothetical protein
MSFIGNQYLRDQLDVARDTLNAAKDEYAIADAKYLDGLRANYLAELEADGITPGVKLVASIWKPFHGCADRVPCEFLGVTTADNRIHAAPVLSKLTKRGRRSKLRRLIDTALIHDGDLVLEPYEGSPEQASEAKP